MLVLSVRLIQVGWDKLSAFRAIFFFRKELLLTSQLLFGYFLFRIKPARKRMFITSLYYDSLPSLMHFFYLFFFSDFFRLTKK